jgi:hypothetical protein
MEKVDLREVWTREADEFTPWLASEENIRLLGDTLGLDLEVQEQEAGVGPYRADILCKEVESDRVVVIENQIEATDHTHLGQLLTYAAGLQAAIVVWVAKSFTDEHRAALDWLNENSNGKIGFFGVEIEVWRIADSPPAPRFSIVAKPNTWATQMQAAVRASGLSERHQFRLKYWAALASYLKANGSSLRCGEPTRNTSIGAQCPVPGFRCGFQLSVKNRFIYVWLGTRKEENVHVLEQLKEKQLKAFERDLGAKTEWEEYPDRNRIWVYISQEADPADAQDWPRQHDWMNTMLHKLVTVFRKYALQASKEEEPAKH